jgi:hypothetical protein
MRIDDAIVRWCGAEVEVSIGDARVGALDVEDSARYEAVLRQADCGIETSGMVLIDAAGHPGAHVKLYLPDPQLVVPVNTVDPAVPLFPAHDRAGGLTLAKHKSEHAMIESATLSW